MVYRYIKQQSLYMKLSKFGHNKQLAILFKKWANPGLFLFIFGLFKQTLQIFTTNKCEKITHPVYGTGIRTHDLRSVILLP